MAEEETTEAPALETDLNNQHHPDELDVAELDDTHLASPIVKIPGGKRDLAPEIISLMPATMRSYMEPFFGGGAVFFELYRAGRLANMKDLSVNDIDTHLVEMYEAVVSDPDDLHDRLTKMHEQYVLDPERCYYHVRNLWNQRHWSPAKNIFLRMSSFNGLWRENKAGEMNASWGKRPKLSLPSLERLRAVSTALSNVYMSSGPYEDAVAFDEDFKRPGTVLYLDPPYLQGWVDYNKHGWSASQAVKLLKTAHEWSEAGAHVVVSHSDAPVFRDLLSKHWPGCHIHKTTRRNRVNRDGAGRGPVPELIVVSRLP